VRDYLYVIQVTSGTHLSEGLYDLLISIFQTPGSPLFIFVLLFLAIVSVRHSSRMSVRVFMTVSAAIAVALLVLSGTRTYWLGFMSALAILAVGAATVVRQEPSRLAGIITLTVIVGLIGVEYAGSLGK